MDNANKVKSAFLNIIYVLLPTIALIYSCDFNDAQYQTDKDIVVSKVIFLITVVIFVIERVKLLNITSLATTCVLIPVYYLYSRRFIESPDVVKLITLRVAIQWLVLMIIIDLILKGEVKNLIKRLNPVSVAVLLVLFGLMRIFAHGRWEPLVLIFPILLFFSVYTSHEDYENLVFRFSNAWFFAFVYIVIRSFIRNPYTGGRYYGSFVNIGQFGIFVGGAFAAALFSIIASKKRYTRKSFYYVMSVIGMAFVLGIMLIINTRTMLIGAVMSLSMLFIFGGNISSKKRMKRFLLLFGIFVFFVVAVIVLLNVCKNFDKEYWDSLVEAGGIKGFVGFFVSRILYMMDSSTSFNYRLFKEMPVINTIDKFTSGRIVLAVEFLKRCTLTGTIGEGFLVRKYYAYSAHNAFIDFTYQYGIIAGIYYIGFWIYSIVVTIKGYLKNRSISYLMPLLFVPMTLGLMTGETLNLFFGTMMFNLIYLKPVFIKEDRV